MNNNFYIAGSNAAEVLALSQDVSDLEQTLIEYMKNYHKDVKYDGFYDKKFLDLMKSTIKQPEQFYKFLDQIQYEMKEFILLSIYICPSVYTTATIKFIKNNYDLQNPYN